jgi:predicted DNA binding CopG/RHH family protein
MELHSNNDKKSDSEDHLRLFEKGEYNASVIAAFRLLEKTLSETCNTPKTTSFFDTLNQLNADNENDEKLLQKVKDYRKIRNKIIHTNTTIPKKEARDIVMSVDKLCKLIKNKSIICVC